MDDRSEFQVLMKREVSNFLLICCDRLEWWEILQTVYLITQRTSRKLIAFGLKRMIIYVKSRSHAMNEHPRLSINVALKPYKEEYFN